jgi:hypothetical protein
VYWVTSFSKTCHKTSHLSRFFWGFTGIEDRRQAAELNQFVGEGLKGEPHAGTAAGGIDGLMDLPEKLKH